MLIQDVHVQVHQPSRARIAFSANAVTVPVTAGFVQASKFRESWNLSTCKDDENVHAFMIPAEALARVSPIPGISRRLAPCFRD